MDITVIVCTHNRGESLSQTLDSLAASSLPSSCSWEVLVVDNDSSDCTRDVANAFCARSAGRFRYVFERHPGLSTARNSGVRAALGEILAFTDDDVTVDPAWLRNLTARLKEDKQWAGAGGRTLPTQPFSPPEWLSQEQPVQWGGVLGGLFDLGDKAGSLSIAPYGTNMAFRKEMFEKYGEFRSDLGRGPGNLMSCEDTEFGQRLLEAGEHLHYEPSALVYHPILASRVQKAYFLDWWFNYGRSKAREKYGTVGRAERIRMYLETPAIVGARLFVRTLRWMRCLNRAQRFSFKCRVWATMGQVLEIYRR